MSRFGTVKVAGTSMAPSYNHGDWLLVRWFANPPENGSPLLGKIVVIERDERPGIFLVKRVEKSHAGNFWVQGDNEASTDSRSWGWIPPHEIVGIVLARIKKTRSKNKEK